MSKHKVPSSSCNNTVFSASLSAISAIAQVYREASERPPTNGHKKWREKISPLCKWNGMFPLRPVETEKVEHLGRLSVCSGKFPLEPRVPFAFQPVEPEILAKWKAPLITCFCPTSEGCIRRHLIINSKNHSYHDWGEGNYSGYFPDAMLLTTFQTPL